MMQRRKTQAGEFLLAFAVFAVATVSAKADQTLLDIAEDTSSRNANTRVWVYEYEFSASLDPEEVIPVTRRVAEKGTGINYISGYDEEANPIWEKTVADFVLTGGGYLAG